MSQRAAYLVKLGKPLEVRERPIPTPADDQVLVRLSATSINVINPYQRAAGVYVNSFPAILGTNGAGKVVKIGSKVHKFKVGDTIVYQPGFGDENGSTFQEYAVIGEDFGAKVPPSLSAIEASTLPTSIATAFVGLFDEGTLAIKPPYDGPTVSPESSILIFGGSSTVGQAALQFAKIAGFGTILTTSSPSHFDEVKSLGATHVIDKNDADVIAKIKKIIPSPSLVFDPTGSISNPPTTPLYKELLSPHGGIISVVNPYESADLPSNIKVPFTLGVIAAHPGLAGPFWKGVEKWLAEGKLVPHKVITYEGIEKIDEALDKVAQGTGGFKIAVKLD